MKTNEEIRDVYAHSKADMRGFSPEQLMAYAIWPIQTKTEIKERWRSLPAGNRDRNS
jgi:hypothetical protein